MEDGVIVGEASPTGPTSPTTRRFDEFIFRLEYCLDFPDSNGGVFLFEIPGQGDMVAVEIVDHGSQSEAQLRAGNPTGSVNWKDAGKRKVEQLPQYSSRRAGGTRWKSRSRPDE